MRTHPVLKVSSVARLSVFALALSLAATGAATTAFAAGTDSKDCPAGQTWSDSARKCVPANSDQLIDQEVTERGRQLARDGNYEEAIALLSTLEGRANSVALTYLGYSYRKLGQVDLGLSYYHQALALDPDDVDAREYLGEGYVATGQIDLARTQLAEIEQRCGTTCEQYEELEEAIEAAM
jgi:tetratricopeptide (TPR) repeat protein